MTGMFAKVSLCFLTSALCCGGMGLYGQSALPVDEGTLLKQELELAKMERENLELRRELLKAQESAQRGEAAVAHIAELKRQMQTLTAARDEAMTKAEQTRAKADGLEAKVGKLSADIKKARKDLSEQSASIDMLKADVAREREVAEIAMKKLVEEQKAHRATQQAGKTVQERQGQETKKLQAELSRQSGRIESLEADAAKHLLDVKVLEANSSRQTQRIQFLEAEVERHLQTIKTLEESCATERLAKAALEAQVVQLTAAKEQKLSGEPVEAQAEEVVEKKTDVQLGETSEERKAEKVEVLPEEKVETTVRQLVEPKDKPAADSLKSLLDELSPDRMLLKAPAGSAN